MRMNGSRPSVRAHGPAFGACDPSRPITSTNAGAVAEIPGMTDSRASSSSTW
jgi:hypothetical protein